MQQMKIFPGNDKHLNNGPKVAECETGSWKLSVQRGNLKARRGTVEQNPVCTQVALCLVSRQKHKRKPYVTVATQSFQSSQNTRVSAGGLSGGKLFLFTLSILFVSVLFLCLNYLDFQGFPLQLISHKLSVICGICRKKYSLTFVIITKA